MHKKSSFPLSFLFVWFFVGLISAQNSGEALTPVTGTYVITNAKIVQKPGKVIEVGNIIIKDGLIGPVGTRIGLPPDAKIIEGDSMYVYPGFIAGISHIGVPKPEAPARGQGQKVDHPGKPGNKAAGIQPEVQLVDVLSVKDKSIADMRKAGFTAAHVVPRGRMLPGSGGIILLEGDAPGNMILDQKVSLYSRLAGASGRVYPSTVIGVMSKWRELYQQAEQAQEHEKKYAENPAGMPRPNYDRSLQAFYPVLDKDIPVVFEAGNSKTVWRVLGMQKELGFPLVLADLQQGWHVLDQLKGQNIPVMLSMDLPKEKKKKDEKKEEDKEEDPEVAMLQKKKAATLKQYQGQAGTFEKEGIPFSFSFLDVKAGDVKNNLMTMIENGLSEDAALAALTTTPAKQFGLSKILGTVETGKIANLFVTDAPYFSKDANIRYVFVDGKLHEYEAKPKKKAGDPNAKVNVAGSWSYTIKTPDQEREGILKIKSDDGDLSGTISNPETGDEADMESLELSGNELNFTSNISIGPQSIQLSFNLVIDGDAMEGSVTVGEFGTFDVEGSRDSTPE